jgi:N6-adenosine-specific RNA methylase IME4
LSEDQFAEKVEQAKKNAISALNRTTTEEKQEARAVREAELGAKIIAMPGNPYAVIYADPPWRFEPYSRDTGMDRAADNHYPTMTLDKIKELEVPTASDAVLFLWAIVPMLPEALAVMDAWGFKYVSSFVWVKDRIGTGYWTRNQHELLLIGTKGSVPAPAPGQQYPSIFQGPVGDHSAKPIAFRDAIEKMFPTLPRIELFAREKCVGWDVWGFEAPQQAAE